MAELAKALELKGASSVQNYENPDRYKGGFIDPKIVRKLLKTYVGKGEPPITAEEVAELAGPEFFAIHQIRAKGLNDHEAQVLAKKMGIVTIHGELPYLNDEAPIFTTNYDNLIAEVDGSAGLGGGGFANEGGTLTVGGDRLAADAIRDYWRLPTWLLHNMNTRSESIKAIQTKGDSMEPTLYSGDVVFIDLNHRIVSPEGLYAILDSFGGVVVKRLEISGRTDDGDVWIDIIADNPRHSRKRERASQLHVVGRVAGRFSVT